MEDFQTSVNIAPAKGIPGGDAGINPILSAPFNYLAKEGVVVGQFCWDNGDGTVSGTTATATALPVGFVHLDRINTAVNLTSGPSLEIPTGGTVEVVAGGDYYAIASAAVTKGQPVFADTTTGKLYGATGANYVQTNFKWAEDVAARGIGVISTNFQ